MIVHGVKFSPFVSTFDPSASAYQLVVTLE